LIVYDFKDKFVLYSPPIPHPFATKPLTASVLQNTAGIAQWALVLCLCIPIQQILMLTYLLHNTELTTEMFSELDSISKDITHFNEECLRFLEDTLSSLQGALNLLDNGVITTNDLILQYSKLISNFRTCETVFINHSLELDAIYQQCLANIHQYYPDFVNPNNPIYLHTEIIDLKVELDIFISQLHNMTGILGV